MPSEQPERDVLRDQRRPCPSVEELDMGVYMKYADLFKHLDFNTDMGWGWLPPSDEVFDAFRYVADNIRPSNMLEIGYYNGHSTSYWAELLPNTQIRSCCPDHIRFLKSYRQVERAYGGRVEVIGIKSPQILDYFNSGVEDMYQFDFMFIDGSHICEDVFTDIHVAIRLHAKHLLFDNASDRGVQMAIDWYVKHGILEQIKRWEYVGLCKNQTRWNDLTLFKVVSGHPLDM